MGWVGWAKETSKHTVLGTTLQRGKIDAVIVYDLGQFFPLEPPQRDYGTPIITLLLLVVVAIYQVRGNQVGVYLVWHRSTAVDLVQNETWLQGW